MVEGAIIGDPRSSLELTSRFRGGRAAVGVGVTKAQTSARGHSNPRVATPNHPATLMAAACGCCRWRASRPGNCPKKTIITMATAMRTAKTEKAIASRTPKVDSTAEAPFFEFQASDLGWCREIGWNPERQALTY